MKKALFVFLITFFVTSKFSNAQDIIYKTDGSKEEAKVTLVGDKTIEYKKYNNPDGPVYSVSKNEIMLITYENGEYETFSEVSKDQIQEDQPDLHKDFAKNIISYHLFDLVFGDFAFSYERIFANGQVSIKIPIAFGYDYYNDTYDFNNIFYSGIGVNFYPTGQGKWRYFMGPHVRIGLGQEWDWVYYYDENGNYLYDEDVEDQGIYTKFFVDNGVAFTPVKNFSISAIASIGIRYFPEAAYDEDVVRTDGAFALNISYRF
jgi:hypothetical protein